MSEEKLLTDLAATANSLPFKSVDLTVGVMKSIKEELNSAVANNKVIELESFRVFYWTSGISVAVAVIFIIGLSLYGANLLTYSDFSWLNLMVSS